MKALIALALVTSLGICDAKPSKKPKRIQNTVSYLVADEYGNILNESNGKKIRSIASISKLVVALLASFQNLDEELLVPYERYVSTIIPKDATFLTRRNLLILSLVKSDNFATQILCNNIENCIYEMNSVVARIGMNDTKFVEPTGLSNENVSSAEDLLKLILEISNNRIISEITSYPAKEILINEKNIVVKNTNPLTGKYNTVLSKTGFIKSSGGCIVMSINFETSRRIFIILGSKNTKTRIFDLEKLIIKNIS
jgi:D-alanyl-D-alanine endopeptidase (penicillin-binding protein 7)